MSFEARVIGFSERFLSERTFELVVAPALADLEFDPGRRPLARIANRFSVVRAVAGGVGREVWRDSGSFVVLTLLPAGYYTCLLMLCFDAFKTWSDFFGMVALIVGMSIAPALVCFWPARRRIRAAD